MPSKTKKTPAKTTTVQGLVVAVDWNDDDEVPSQVAILTEADVEILVEDTPAARGLLELEDAEVEVEGVLDSTDAENPVLRVSTFRVLSEPSSEVDELEDELEDDLDAELDDAYQDEYDEYDQPPEDDDQGPAEGED